MERDFERTLKDLHSDDVEARLKAVKELVETDNDKFLAHLIEALGDPEWRIRKTAVAAISSKERNEKLIEELVSIFHTDTNIGKKNAVAEVLISLGDASLHPIMSSLSSSRKEVKKFLVEILGEIGNKLAAVQLVPLLKDPYEVVRLVTL